MFVRNLLRSLPILAAVAGIASADLTPVFFHIDATNASGTASFDVMTVDVAHDTGTGTYSWSTGPVALTSGSNTIATLTSAFVTIIGDPIIGISFSAVAGSSDTTFHITTGTLSFDSLANASAVASAGITVTDSDGNTANVTGADSSGNSFDALYNGPTVFASLISGVSASAPFGSSTVSDINGPASLSNVGDLTVSYSFTVSANDQASSTSAFNVTPEPASLMMLVCGAAVFGLRHRSRSA
jgi:hypothetical protein